jgi:hypothetical protein
MGKLETGESEMNEELIKRLQERLALLRDAAGNLYMAYNAFTRNDAIAWEPLKETADRITALLDSGIKDAGDAVVEPEYLIRLRNALKGFKSDGAFAGDKDIVDYIDSLQSALQVAQQERDEKRLQWQNWRSRMGLTASATELLERAEKAEQKVTELEKTIESLK